jgi:hypothetical protein
MAEKPKRVMKIAPDEALVYDPLTGKEITHAQLKQFLMEQVKAKRVRRVTDSFTRDVLRAIMEDENFKKLKVFTRKQFRNVVQRVRAEKYPERKVGIVPSTVLRKGYIARTKVEGMGPAFFITAEGAKFATPEGEEAPTAPVPTAEPEVKEAASEALAAIAEESEETEA